MRAPETCLRCRGSMEPGFVVDRGHHSSPGTQEWVEGEVERNFWSGIKTKGRTKLAVRTYRCEKCGLLESYALEGE